MSKQLDGKRIAMLATDGFEQVELTEPKKNLEKAGAEVTVLSVEKTPKEIKGWKFIDWGDRYSPHLYPVPLIPEVRHEIEALHEVRDNAVHVDGARCARVRSARCAVRGPRGHPPMHAAAPTRPCYARAACRGSAEPAHCRPVGWGRSRRVPSVVDSGRSVSNSWGRAAMCQRRKRVVNSVVVPASVCLSFRIPPPKFGRARGGSKDAS